MGEMLFQAAKQHKKIEELRGEVKRLEEVVADLRQHEPIQWHEPSQSVSRAGEPSSSNIVQVRSTCNYRYQLFKGDINNLGHTDK